MRCLVVIHRRLNLTLFLCTNLSCHPEDDHHDVEDDGELFFFLLKKEPTVISELVEFGPCVSAETEKACALIGPHLMAEENALWLGSDLSPGLRDLCRNGCPKRSEWISSGPTSEADLWLRVS